MKNLCPLGLLVACFLAAQSLSAQPVTKPGLDGAAFTKLPGRIEFAQHALRKIPTAKLQEKISLQFGDVTFAGQVVEKIQRSPEVLNMNIRLTNYPGALLTLSVVTDEDKTQRLVGRIVNPQADEVLVLTEENNRYFFVKQPKQFFMTE